MAEVEIAPQFGLELKDGFKPVNAWVTNGIQWLDDIQQFYRERSAIEKEYSQKLSALAKKYYDRKTKKSSSLSVGDAPTVTPGSLESASMTTWATQLSTLESRAISSSRVWRIPFGICRPDTKSSESSTQTMRPSWKRSETMRTAT